jgi:hypothetical protein
MTLVQSWIDSLQLLKPKNLQLFALVTLKSIVEAYKLLLKYFWWLFVLTLVCGVAVRWNPASFATAHSWLYQLLLFATCLATRPSVAKKDCAYFRAHMFAFVYVAIYLIIWPPHLWPTAFSPWDIFLILFFLDSERGPKNFLFSMWYALKMIIFNFPLMVILGFLFNVSVYFYSTIYHSIIGYFVVDVQIWAKMLLFGLMLHNVLAILLIPIGICTYANIYIKKLHDQFDLYFKQPQ